MTEQGKSRWTTPEAPGHEVLADNSRLVERIERRTLLRGGLSLGALTLLTGCDVSNRDSVWSALKGISEFNDRVQAWLFRPGRLAPEYAAEDVLKPPRFNAFYSIDKVVTVDPATWRLEVAGLAANKEPWTYEAIRALPEVTQRTRHICVEGWDYIGEWTGVPLKLFLEKIGADTQAKYIHFRCADGYASTLDMPTALHAQTQLTTKYAGEVLTPPFGFPIRLRAATKLGFKTPKSIMTMEVTNLKMGGYWEDKSYNWFSGI